MVSIHPCIISGVIIATGRINTIPLPARHNPERLVGKLQSATAQLETIRELYQNNEDPLMLAEQLQGVIGALKKIRSEVVIQELTRVVNPEALPAATRKATGAKLFQLMVR
jgi:DNA-binding FrmR family transcriptional regulator